jgi:hypothetical protein
MKSSILVVLVLTLATPIFAQQDEDNFGEAFKSVVQISQMEMQFVPETPQQPKPKGVVAKFLGLTADQVTAWDKLITARGDTIKPLQEQLKANGDLLRDALKQATPDALVVGNLVIKEKNLLEQVGAALKKYVQDFEALLTEEQKNKLQFIRRADQAQPLIGAFEVTGLLPRGVEPPK